MPDPVTPPAPAGGDPPPAPPPAAVTPPAPSPAAVNMTSEQLTARLREAEASGASKLLKELGHDKADTVREALAKLRTAETDKLSEKEKLEARIKELEPGAKRGDLLAAVVEEQLQALPEAVRTTIEASAGSDPEKRLDALRLYRSMRSAQPAAPVVPGVTPPAHAAPSPAPSPSGASTKYQEWEAMKARAPMLGDIFYQSHQREIERTRPAS